MEELYGTQEAIARGGIRKCSFVGKRDNSIGVRTG